MVLFATLDFGGYFRRREETHESATLPSSLQNSACGCTAASGRVCAQTAGQLKPLLILMQPTSARGHLRTGGSDDGNKDHNTTNPKSFSQVGNKTDPLEEMVTAETPG